MKLVAVMQNGDKIKDMEIRDLFPGLNNQFVKEVDFIEITSDLFTVRVSPCFLMLNESGKWFANVLNGKGEYVRWNGTIYNGGIVYINNVKIALGDKLGKYQAIIAARDELLKSVKERI